MRSATVKGPLFKAAGSYLHPDGWYGDPVPPNKIGPYGAHAECWWYNVVFDDGGRKSFAAEGPGRAWQATLEWLRDNWVVWRHMDDVETLPCGCRCGQLGDTFWYEPCADDCEHFQFVLAEADRQDKPTTVVDMR